MDVCCIGMDCAVSAMCLATPLDAAPCAVP